MTTNKKPAYPVIWLGDTCGLMHFRDEESFFTTELMSWGPITLDWGCLVCSEGMEWSASVSRTEPISLGKRLKALPGRTVQTRVEYEYTEANALSLDELKARLIQQSENDPGDVMWQFVEHDDIVEGVTAAGSFEELFEFLRLSVCGEGEAWQAQEP